MTSFLRTIAGVAILAVFSVGAAPVFAQTTVTNTGSDTTVTNTGSTGLTNPLNNINSLPEFMNAILDAVVQLGSIVLVFAIMYVGFKFVTAQGNEEEIRSARTALMWVVIGGLVLLGAKTVGLVITSTVQQL